MPRLCEICGRLDEQTEENHDYEILDVCEHCSLDRFLIESERNSERHTLE